MGYLEIFFIAFALAIDAFAVSFAAGSYFGKATAHQKFRLSFHFGLFQFFMPIAGWLAGSEIVTVIEDYDHWIACIILFIIGAKMIKDAISGEEGRISKDISKGFSLINLSVATSIDALAVGFGIGILKGDILFPSVIIGIVAASLSLVGIKLGERISLKFGSRVAAFGGVILILIGLNIVFSHLNLFSRLFG
jgi:putative Mn2+ efflux pump MntP